MGEPRSSRPEMPGYGLDPGPEGLLPWSWAAERLERTKTYLVATVTPGGAPHVMPVWAVWMDGALVFSTGEQSKKARNLAANPRCTVAVERDDEAVLVEGTAVVLQDAELKARVLAAYSSKYAWDMSNDSSPWFVVRPERAFGFIDREGEFGRTATRWTF